MRSVMSHSFSQVPSAQIPRSSFNRTSGFKTTFDGGYLVPFFLDMDVLPGDTFNLKATLFARLATPIVPFMDNLHCETFFFFVPNRLVWSNWEKFNGQQTDPDDSTDYLMPQIVAPTSSPTGYAIGTLYDYMGLPTGIPTISHRADPLRAYNLIWNEWFRDENLQNSLTVPLTDGPDAYTLYTLQKRGARHDYFTSCLPWPQKGPAVPLPLGDSAPVYGEAVVNNSGYGLFQSWNDNNSTREVWAEYKPAGTLGLQASTGISGDSFQGTQIATKADYVADPLATPAYVDLSDATASTINALRQAFQLQRLYERDARGGTRYTEIIRAHFGVTSPDARLQRPEYLGGGSTPINVHPIAQTSSTDATTPQGNLAAMGTMSANGHGFTKSFTEHGIILGLVCVRADLNYQQGMNRGWSRRTRWDFYWPALSHIGEQAVLNKEIYCQGPAVTDADGIIDDQVFGYQERYAEYRYKPSQITGLFRSTAAGSLDIWHLAKEFTALPVLDAGFIEENPPIDRVSAVPDEPNFLLDCFISLQCARPMPVYSVPGLIDHF